MILPHPRWRRGGGAPPRSQQQHLSWVGARRKAFAGGRARPFQVLLLLREQCTLGLKVKDGWMFFSAVVISTLKPV